MKTTTEHELNQLLPKHFFVKPNRIKSAGYPVEDHEIITDDGYILHVFRIPHGKKSVLMNRIRPPILLMHGFLDSSNGFIVLGAKHSLGKIIMHFLYNSHALN